MADEFEIPYADIGPMNQELVRGRYEAAVFDFIERTAYLLDWDPSTIEQIELVFAGQDVVTLNNFSNEEN